MPKLDLTRALRIKGHGGELAALAGDGFSWRPSLAPLFRNDEAGIWVDPSDPEGCFTTSTGSTLAGPGDPVGRILDKSGNDKHPTQATAAARPIRGRHPEGGRRNKLIRTEEFDNAAWFKNEEATIAITTLTGPNGVLLWKYAAGMSSDFQRIWQNVVNRSGNHTFQFVVKAAEYAHFHVRSGLSGTNRSVAWNLTTGEITFAHSFYTNPFIEPLGDGHYLVGATMDIVANSSLFFQFQPTAQENNTISQFAGDGSSGGLVSSPQLEPGSVATPYQRVGNQHDVTEEGKRDVWYARAAATQFLRASLPDLGSDATIAYVRPNQAPVIHTGQTIGAGNFDIGPGADLDIDEFAALVIIDRALTAGETGFLTGYLNHKGGN